MREMADRYLSLDVDARPERPLVVDPERVDAVLVRYAEGCAEEGAVGSCGDGLEVQTLEGREHGELELERIVRRNHQRL